VWMVVGDAEAAGQVEVEVKRCRGWSARSLEQA